MIYTKTYSLMIVIVNVFCLLFIIGCESFNLNEKDGKQNRFIEKVSDDLSSAPLKAENSDKGFSRTLTESERERMKELMNDTSKKFLNK